MRPHDQEYDVVACKAAAVSDSPKGIDHEDFGFSAAELAAATRAVLSVHDASVHYTYAADVDPTPTKGHMLQDLFDPQVIWGNRNVNNLKFIREASTDAVVTVTLEAPQGTYGTTTSTTTSTTTT